MKRLRTATIAPFHPLKMKTAPNGKVYAKRAGARPGGQKGRKGNTLKMFETPDIIEKYIPDYFSCCGKDVSSQPYEFAGKCQVSLNHQMEHLFLLY